MSEISFKPYFLRAVHKWCTDNHYTPEIVVIVDTKTQVPMQFIKDSKIIFNISFEATKKLEIGNDMITFSARFGGISKNIIIPISNIIAIYASENNQGMTFEVPTPDIVSSQITDQFKKPTLKLVTLTTIPTVNTKESYISMQKSSTDVKFLQKELMTGQPILIRIK